jgi:hypothetical protein
VRRTALILVAVAALTTGAVAYAAGLGPIAPAGVGSDSAGVAPCDPDGFTVSSWVTSQGNVTQATIGGIKEPDCAGGALSVTLTDSSGAGIGTATTVTVPSAADPGSVTVGFPSGQQPYAGNVAGFRVAIVGP